jgi:hypothetical protein
MDSSRLKISGRDYDFLRVRNQEIFEGRSPQFRKIYIITTIEQGTSLILFLPLKADENKPAPTLQLSTMHDNVKNAINSFTQENTYEAGKKQIWIP